MNKPLWLFDFDGVIADSLSFFEPLLRTSLQKIGFHIISERRHFLDLFHDNLYSSLSKKGLRHEDLERLFGSIERETDFSSVKLFNGIIETITQIKTFANVAIVSSNRESQIEIILNANNARNYFETILGVNSDRSKTVKIRRAMTQFGNNCENTFYVFDTTGDFSEAHEAGVNSVAVGWGWHSPDELLNLKPDYFVKDLPSLLNLAQGSIKN